MQINYSPQPANFCKQNTSNPAFKGFLKIPFANIKNVEDTFTFRKTLEYSGPLGNTMAHAEKTGNILKVVAKDSEELLCRYLDKVIGKGKYILENFSGTKEGDLSASVNRFNNEMKFSPR